MKNDFCNDGVITKNNKYRMNIIKFARIIDIVQRILRCRDEYPSLKLTGSFVYNYIALCEYYGLEWTNYTSVEWLEKERGNTIHISSIVISISAFAYSEYLDTIQNIYDEDIDNIDSSKSSLILTFSNILTSGYDTFEIIVIAGNSVIEASIFNICWDGRICSLLDSQTFQFITNIEERADRGVLNFQDPCVQRYVYREFVLADIFQKNAVLYPMFMSYPEILIKAHRLGISEGFHVTADLSNFKLEIYPTACEQPVEDCSICKEKMGFGVSFNDRTVIRLKCTNVMHSFHINCITKWIVRTHKNSCPMCRKEVEDSFFHAYSKSPIYLSSSSL